ncbi:MAG TPA: hypothetical protein DCF68_12070 [Cyanothece sp. UBA12306]|nr:hypothetical protein [Cyanothece sp. UBA12306]
MLPLDETGSLGQPFLIQRRDIIATVLIIIQGAWVHVCQRENITINCDEPRIAGALYHEMWNEKERRGISGPPRIENESAERQSEESLKPDGFIDFKMIYGWTQQDYFGIECKRVSSVTQGNNRNLATEYVTNGIMRFVKGIYSPNHDFAAMLGFVIDGNIDNCVNRIQRRINDRTQILNLEENWITEDHFGNYQDLYRTRHGQIDLDNAITLLHLFVTIN